MIVFIEAQYNYTIVTIKQSSFKTIYKSMKKEHYHTEIEPYLTGELKGVALANFEKQLSIDQGLAEEVQALKTLVGGIKVMQMKAVMQQVHEEVVGKPAPSEEPTGRVIQLESRKNWFWSITVGVTATALLLFGIYQFQAGNKSCTELYTDAMTTTKAPIMTTLGEMADDEKALALAYDHYINEAYHEAIPHFKSYLMANRTDYEKGILLGICYTETNQFDKAQQLFKNIKVQCNERSNQATWFLALSYLKQDDIKNCKRQLRWLMAHTSPQQDRYKDAEQLLDELG